MSNLQSETILTTQPVFQDQLTLLREVIRLELMRWQKLDELESALGGVEITAADIDELIKATVEADDITDNTMQTYLQKWSDRNARQL